MTRRTRRCQLLAVAGVVVAAGAGLACRTGRPAASPSQSAICTDCFWRHQPAGLRDEVLNCLETRPTNDPLARADLHYTAARISGDAIGVCRARDEFSRLGAQLDDPARRLLARETEAFLAAECGANPAPLFRRLAHDAAQLGDDVKARIYRRLGAGRLRPEFGAEPIRRNLQPAPDATAVVLGESVIRLHPGARVGAQVERTVRDWLSCQTSWDFRETPVSAAALLEYHEGRRLRDLLAAAPVTVAPLSGTLAARRGEFWYAPDETGVFRFLLETDKVQCPTNRVYGDLALLVDTHGLSALVVQALERHVDLVVGCGDSPAKMQAAYHLARRGIACYFPCDRFVAEVLGHNARAPIVGSAPIRRDGDDIVIGGRPITLGVDEIIVVGDAAVGGRVGYYDAPARYFRRLRELAPLRLEFVVFERAGDAERLVARARDLGADIIATRVETPEDAAPVARWLAESPRRRAVLFHTAPYAAGWRLFEDFPAQTSFGDPRPRFVR